MNVSQEVQTHLKKLHQLHLNGADDTDDLTAIVQLNLLGDQGGNYGLRIHNGQINTGVGYAKSPDLTFTMAAEDFLAVAKDKSNALSMVLSGRIEMKGDRALALRVASILQGM